MADDTDTPAEAPPPQKSALARQHLAAIGRDGTMLFRAIMDDPERKNKPGFPTIELHGTLGERQNKLRLLNDAGYGVFFQVNMADGSGFKAANITAATCFFADFDGTPLENVERLALPPHLTVATSPGKKHFYWRVDGIPVGEFTAVQKRLIRLFGSDKSIHDLPRIMRLAGFLHQKHPEAPHLVAVEVASEAAPYPYDQFVVAVAAAEKAHGVGEKVKRRLPTSIAAPADRNLATELARAESALRHCIEHDELSLGDRDDWINVGIALKSSYGEDGFALWVKLSIDANGFEGQDDCRRQWETFRNDRPADQRLTIATFFAKARDCGWQAGDTGQDGRGAGGTGGIGKPDAASIVLDQVEAAGDERFLDKDGIAYVRFRRRAGDEKAPHVVARIDSELYKGMLRRRFHLEAGNKTLPKEQLNNAVDLLRAEAIERDERRAVHLRVGEHEGRVYVDLGRGDGQAVEIDPAGAELWQVVSEPPVLFLAGARGALPLPVPGGELADFERHLPSLDRAGVQRVLAFASAPTTQRGPSRC